MNGNSLKINKLCLTYVTTVNEFSTNNIQIQQKKSHIGTVRIYMSSVALSAMSGKVDMHTLRTLVDVSLYQTVHLLSACLIDKNVWVFFVICLSTILLSS